MNLPCPVREIAGGAPARRRRERHTSFSENTRNWPASAPPDRAPWAFSGAGRGGGASGDCGRRFSSAISSSDSRCLIARNSSQLAARTPQGCAIRCQPRKVEREDLILGQAPLDLCARTIRFSSSRHCAPRLRMRARLHRDSSTPDTIRPTAPESNRLPVPCPASQSRYCWRKTPCPFDPISASVNSGSILAQIGHGSPAGPSSVGNAAEGALPTRSDDHGRKWPRPVRARRPGPHPVQRLADEQGPKTGKETPGLAPCAYLPPAVDPVRRAIVHPARARSVQ